MVVVVRNTECEEDRRNKATTAAGYFPTNGEGACVPPTVSRGRCPDTRGRRSVRTERRDSDKVRREGETNKANDGNFGN